MSQGPTGMTGPQGPQGIQGFTGPTGIQGVLGGNGIQGQAGATGARGNTGPIGLYNPAKVQIALSSISKTPSSTTPVIHQFNAYNPALSNAMPGFIAQDVSSSTYFTLPSGDYWIKAYAPTVSNLGRTQLILSTYSLPGYSISQDIITSPVNVVGVFDPSGTTQGLFLSGFYSTTGNTVALRQTVTYSGSQFYLPSSASNYTGITFIKLR